MNSFWGHEGTGKVPLASNDTPSLHLVDRGQLVVGNLRGAERRSLILAPISVITHDVFRDGSRALVVREHRGS